MNGSALFGGNFAADLALEQAPANAARMFARFNDSGGDTAFSRCGCFYCTGVGAIEAASHKVSDD